MPSVDVHPFPFLSADFQTCPSLPHFCVTLLPAKAFDFADGHALDSYIGQSGLNVLQLEWFDYGFDELHFFCGYGL